LCRYKRALICSSQADSDVDVYPADAISSAVIFSFFLCRDRYIGGGVADRLESLHVVELSSGQVFSPFGGDIFRVSKCETKKGRGGQILGI